MESSKKFMTALLTLAMAISFAACGNNTDKDASKDANKQVESTETADTEKTDENAEDSEKTDENTENAEKTDETAENTEDAGKPEVSKVRWNSGTSGNVLVTIAEEKGYFKDQGLEIENVPADANADAMTMLSTGKVDVVSNAGTSNPLQQISAGIDLTIFGGHMVQGAMPVVAKKGTKWNGIKDLVGKKFACNPSYFAFTGALMDAGVEDPLNEVSWETYTDYNDALAAVTRGEVDYALMGTGQCYTVKNMDDIDIVTWHGEVMPNYSCCRMVAQSDFVKNNPNTIKNILIALIRAQDFYEHNKEEALKIHAAKINAKEDYVAAYMLDDHYKVHVDPLRKSVERAWGILDKTGFLKEKAKEINIDDHVNTDLYQEALKEAKEKYGAESKDFYESLEQFYSEND